MDTRQGDAERLLRETRDYLLEQHYHHDGRHADCRACILLVNLLSHLSSIESREGETRLPEEPYLIKAWRKGDTFASVTSYVDDLRVFLFQLEETLGVMLACMEHWNGGYDEMDGQEYEQAIQIWDNALKRGRAQAAKRGEGK